jgi:hypothetical protein
MGYNWANWQCGFRTGEIGWLLHGFGLAERKSVLPTLHCFGAIQLAGTIATDT